MIGAIAVLAAALLAVDGPGTVQPTAAQLAALPRTSVDWTVHGKALHCTGPWLIDVLAAAGVATGDAVRGTALTTLVVATGHDGYRVAFTLGELDRTLGNTPVVVGERCDGVALADGDGPYRLIPARDLRGARGVRGLVRLTVTALPPTP